MNVSVIIPVYNAVDLVEKAITSALNHKEVSEVILIEDGGTDGSYEKCKSLVAQNSKVKLFQHANGANKGAGASRNLGILNASEEYISFLDADDYYTAIRFGYEKKIFQNNPNCDGVYGAIGVEYLDSSGADAWESIGNNEESLTTVSKPIPSEHLFEYIVGVKNENNYKGYFSIDGLTIKREALLDSKILFTESLRLHQDTVFIWQLAYKLRLFTGEFKKPIAIRGVHANNRFIHTKNLNKSRSKQYMVLRDWANKEKLKKEMIESFQKRFFKNYMYSKHRWLRIVYYVYLFITDSFVRKFFGKKQLKIVWKSVF